MVGTTGTSCRTEGSLGATDPVPGATGEGTLYCRGVVEVFWSLTPTPSSTYPPVPPFSRPATPGSTPLCSMSPVRPQDLPQTRTEWGLSPTPPRLRVRLPTRSSRSPTLSHQCLNPIVSPSYGPEVSLSQPEQLVRWEVRTGLPSLRPP